MTEDISTIKVGIVLQGDGGVSTGAIVLANKMADNYTDVILCYASASTHDPFAVWTYNHENGRCYRGEYFDTIEEAVNCYILRES